MRTDITKECDRCPRRQHAKQVVWGRGSKTPKVIFLGEGPGDVEDETGKNFVGPAGQFLQSLLLDIGFQPSDVRFENSVMCFAEHKPKKSELQTCVTSHLQPTLERFPGVPVVALGNVALKALGIDAKISDVRGVEINQHGRKILPTYHPSFILRLSGTPSYKENQDAFLSDLRWIHKIIYQPEEVLTDEKLQYKVITSYEEWVAVRNLLLQHDDLIAFDCETHRLLPRQFEAKLLGISFCINPGQAWFLPIEHDETPLSLSSQRKHIAADIAEILSKPRKPIAHNAQFDMLWIADRLGIDIADVLYCDTLVVAREVRPQADNKLKTIMRDMYPNLLKYADRLNRVKRQLGMTENDSSYGRIPLDLLGVYSCADVDATLRFMREHESRILSNQNLKSVIFDLVVPALPMLCEATRHGIRVDLQKVDEKIKSCAKSIEKLENFILGTPEAERFSADLAKPIIQTVKLCPVVEDIDQKLRNIQMTPDKAAAMLGVDRRVIQKVEKRAGFWQARVIRGRERLNLRSQRQLSKFLVEYVGVGLSEKTASGRISVAKRSLDSVSGNEIVDAIKRYNAEMKVLNTYLLPICKEHLCVDSAIHPTFNVSNTSTGRLSSQNPNGQNIPRGSDVRDIFVPHHELFVEADISGAELRVIASLADDRVMLEAFMNGDDLHNQTARLIFGLNPGEEEKEVMPGLSARHVAKAINFAIIYGGSGYAISQHLGVDGDGKPIMSVDEAERLREEWLALHTGVAEYMRRQRVFVKRHKYVETPFGRVIPIPEIDADDSQQYNAAIRRAINYPVQSAASDFNLMAATRLYRMLRERNLKTVIVNLVHDSVLLDALVDELDEVIACIDEAYGIQLDWLKTPMKVDVSIGVTWNKKSMVSKEYYMQTGRIF